MERVLVTVLVEIIIAIIATMMVALGDAHWGWATFTLLTFLFVIESYKKIPSDPPHRGVLAFFGRRLTIALKEGWVFLPVYPWVFSVILVNMTKKNMDLQPEGVRTSEDMAGIKVKVAVTFEPDPDHLIDYLNAGGENGVKEILDDVVEASIRERAADPSRKPNTWEEAVRMKQTFLLDVVNKILGRDERPADEEGPLTDEEKELLKDLRSGNGHKPIPTLGIKLNRVNVKSVEPEDDLAKAAQKLAIERRERQAEVVELEHVEERVKRLVTELHITQAQALELIQTERGKVTKTVSQTQLDIAPETRALVATVASGLGSLAEKITTKFVDGPPRVRATDRD